MDAAALAELTRGKPDEVRASAARLDARVMRSGAWFFLLYVFGSSMAGFAIVRSHDALVGREALGWTSAAVLLAAGAFAASILARNHPLRAERLGAALSLLVVPFSFAGALVADASQWPFLIGFTAGLAIVGGFRQSRFEQAMRRDAAFLAREAPELLGGVLFQRAGPANARKAILAVLAILAVAVTVGLAALRWWIPPRIDGPFREFAQAWQRGDAAAVASFLPVDEREPTRASLTRLAHESGWTNGWPAFTEPRWRTSRFHESFSGGPERSVTTYTAYCTAGFDQVETTWEFRGGRWEISTFQIPAIPVASALRDFVTAWNARDRETVAEFAGLPDDRAELERRLLDPSDLPEITSFQARELDHRRTAEVVFLSSAGSLTTRWTAAWDGTWRLADTKWLEDGR